MEPGLSDTDPEAERVHLDLLRRASPSRRLRLAFSLSRTAMSLSRGGLARAFPGVSPREIGLRFVAFNYGPQLAEDVRAAVDGRDGGPESRRRPRRGIPPAGSDRARCR